jgi:hypothetical protein
MVPRSPPSSRYIKKQKAAARVAAAELKKQKAPRASL